MKKKIFTKQEQQEIDQLVDRHSLEDLRKLDGVVDAIILARAKQLRIARNIIASLKG